MPAKLKPTVISTSTYSVPGENLKDILAYMKRKGPLDTNDNKRVAALTETRVHVDTAGAKFEPDGDPESTDDGGKKVRAKFKKLEVEVTASVTFPKLKSPSKLSKAARKEWDRYLKCLGDHEKRHLVMVVSDITALVAELSALRGEGSGPDLASAAKAATHDLFGKLNARCGGTLLEDRQRKIHEHYDHSTGHGAREGAVLDTSVA
jgi:predicted secreted Zn-dependent protease